MKEMSTMLSDDSDSEEELTQLTINEHFAKAYEAKKEREELFKLKEKYGSDAEEEDEDEEDSEEAESEDEDGEELTPAVDAAILRTLARIKKKDPSIYEQGKDVFDEEIKKSGDVKLSSRSGKAKSEKPLTIRQHALQSALNPTSRSPSPVPLTHVREQELLRNETIAAFHTAVDGGEDAEEDLLILREKTKDEIEQQEEEYREFLQREVGEDLGKLIALDIEGEVGLDGKQRGKAEKAEKKKKKQKTEKGRETNVRSKEEKDQEFLINYILNRGWIDRSTKRLPTYREITASSKSKGKGKARADVEESAEDSHNEASGSEGSYGEGIADEDEFDEVADLFESSYNFRFEEPGASEIARYPRNIDSTVRREESHRKEVRERRKERKEQEKQKKKEEVKRMKSLKIKEIRAKLEMVGKEGGRKVDETEALQELDLEGDWDPDAHDAQMSKIYGQDEDCFEGDMEKPMWEDDIDIADIVPPEDEASDKKKKKGKKKKGNDEYDARDEGVNVDEMDADVRIDDDEWDGTEETRKRKLDEYMDEVYGLEFNDMVGDMPTRFKYTKVQPQAFALTPVEILLASDVELNQYMGLKKLAPYRKDGSNWDKNRATRLKELKTTLQERKIAIGAGGDDSQAASEKPAKKRKGKKERLKDKAATNADNEDELEAEELVQKESRKRRLEPNSIEQASSSGVAGAEEPAGPPKAKRRRHKKSGK